MQIECHGDRDVGTHGRSNQAQHAALGIVSRLGDHRPVQGQQHPVNLFAASQRVEDGIDRQRPHLIGDFPARPGRR